MSGNVTEVRLDLLGPTELAYTDDRHIGDTFSETIDPDDLRSDTTDWLSRSLSQKVDFCDAEGLRLLGRHLYKMVFRGTIADTFNATYERFEKDINAGQPCALRIVITFHPAAEALADLPWEFLYYVKKDGGGTFLSGERHELVLIRMVEDQKELKNEPVHQKLRVLAAVCTPRALASGISQASIKRIDAATDRESLAAASAESANTTVISYMKMLHLEQRIELTILPDPTFSILEEAVGKGPDIIHFVGHGAPGTLYMRRSDDQVERDRTRYYVARSAGEHPEEVAEHEQVDVSKVETLFRERKPLLVFLQACYGAELGRGVGLSTALEIVKAGVPAVVAMQHDIDAESADKFASAFYQKLMSGATIANAVSDGRWALAVREGKAWSHRDFGTPVIYMHGDTVVVAPPPLAERSTSPMAPQLRRCGRCGQQCSWRSCPKCRLHFYCQCCKDPSRGCACSAELELPEREFCGKCEHEVKQPLWPVTALPAEEAFSPGPRPVLRSMPPEGDSFESAS